MNVWGMLLKGMRRFGCLFHRRLAFLGNFGRLGVAWECLAVLWNSWFLMHGYTQPKTGSLQVSPQISTPLSQRYKFCSVGFQSQLPGPRSGDSRVRTIHFAKSLRQQFTALCQACLLQPFQRNKTTSRMAATAENLSTDLLRLISLLQLLLK